MPETLCSFTIHAKDNKEGFFLIDQSVRYPQLITFIKEQLHVIDSFVLMDKHQKPIRNNQTLRSLLSQREFTLHINVLPIVRSAACARLVPHVVDMPVKEIKEPVLVPTPSLVPTRRVVCKKNKCVVKPNKDACGVLTCAEVKKGAPVSVPVVTAISSPVVASKKLVKHRAFCDQCKNKKLITGIRYKCLQCADFDLCSGCEANNLKAPFHDENHIFAKVSKPSNYFLIEHSKARKEEHQIQLLNKRIASKKVQPSPKRVQCKARKERLISLETAVQELQTKMDALVM